MVGNNLALFFGIILSSEVYKKIRPAA